MGYWDLQRTRRRQRGRECGGAGVAAGEGGARVAVGGVNGGRVRASRG